jgi:CubicO group peptidase (beta-lactamase class C family)
MILQLVEEGQLRLTDTLDKYFRQFTNARKITILQILSHRSGIPNVSRDQATCKPGEPVTKEEMLALIVNGAPEFEPDTKSSYSISGYFLLNLIVEKLTGKSYDPALDTSLPDASMQTKAKLSPMPITAAAGNAGDKVLKPIRASDSSKRGGMETVFTRDK